MHHLIDIIKSALDPADEPLCCATCGLVLTTDMSPWFRPSMASEPFYTVWTCSRDCFWVEMQELGLEYPPPAIEARTTVGTDTIVEPF